MAMMTGIKFSPLQIAFCAGVVAAAMIGAQPASSEPVAPAKSGKTMGYVAKWFGYAYYKGDHDCPDGMALKPEIKEALAPFSKAEQDRLQLPKNRAEVHRLMYNKGPNGEEICQHPEIVVEAPYRTIQGDTAYGFNLDGNDGTGKPAPNTCTHKNFKGLDGTPGIDNQLYRAQGCQFGWREDGMGGYIEKYNQAMMHDGGQAVLFEFTDVDDPYNDDDVGVGVYQSEDPLIKNASGSDLLADGSLRVSKDPYWHNRTRGKIVNGVLTTDVLPNLHVHLANTNYRPEFNFQRAKLQFTFKPDGSIEGVLGAYQPWEPMFHRRAPGSATNGFTCPAYYAALKALADGDPDPDTGECTTISVAYRIEAIPAFVIHASDKTTAQK